MSVKINARLDDALAQRLAELMKKTGKPLTQIVKEALADHCERELAASRAPFDVLKSAGLIGVSEGPADLSSTYKSELATSLSKKITR